MGKPGHTLADSNASTSVPGDKRASYAGTAKAVDVSSDSSASATQSAVEQAPVDLSPSAVPKVSDLNTEQLKALYYQRMFVDVAPSYPPPPSSVSPREVCRVYLQGLAWVHEELEGRIIICRCSKLGVFRWFLSCFYELFRVGKILCSPPTPFFSMFIYLKWKQTLWHPKDGWWHTIFKD